MGIVPPLTLCFEPHKRMSTDCNLWELGAGGTGEKGDICLFTYVFIYLFLLKEAHHLMWLATALWRQKITTAQISFHFRKNYVVIKSCQYKAAGNSYPGRKGKKNLL